MSDMFKEASVTAKSIDDLVNILNKSRVRNAKNIADNKLFNAKGTGSLVIDLLAGKNKKRMGPKINNAYTNMQRKLANIDIKAGAKTYNYLDKKNSRLGDKLKKTLIQEHDFLTEKVPGKPDKYVKVNVPGITNPLTKAKGAVVPLVGSFTLAGALIPDKEEKKNGGDGIDY